MLDKGNHGEQIVIIRILTEINYLTIKADDLLNISNNISKKNIRFIKEITSEIQTIKENSRKLEEYIKLIKSV